MRILSINNNQHCICAEKLLLLIGQISLLSPLSSLFHRLILSFLLPVAIYGNPTTPSSCAVGARTSMFLFLFLLCARVSHFFLIQAAHEVFTGKFPCNLEQAVRFAALYLQATTGDISTKNYLYEYAKFSIFKKKMI